MKRFISSFIFALLSVIFIKLCLFPSSAFAQSQRFRYGIQITSVSTRISFDDKSPSDFYAHIDPLGENKSTTAFIGDQDFVNTSGLEEWGRTWESDIPGRSPEYGSAVTVRIRDRDKRKKNPLVLEGDIYLYPYDDSNESSCKFITIEHSGDNDVREEVTSPHLPDGSCSRSLDIVDDEQRSIMRIRVSIDPR